MSYYFETALHRMMTVSFHIGIIQWWEKPCCLCCKISLLLLLSLLFIIHSLLCLSGERVTYLKMYCTLFGKVIKLSVCIYCLCACMREVCAENFFCNVSHHEVHCSAIRIKGTQQQICYRNSSKCDHWEDYRRTVLKINLTDCISK